MTYARRAWVVLWKDLLTEQRSKESLNAIVFFTLLLLFIFQFALGPDSELLRSVLPGILWLGFIFAGLLGLGRSFLTERENDCWEGLILTPGDKSAFFVGKLIGNVVLMTVIEALFLVLFGIFYNVDLWSMLPQLALVVFLGTVGLAAVGTTFAAMTADVRARELLFPLLVLPAQVPLLLGTVKATEAVFQGVSLADVSHWLKLLAAADIVYLVVGILTFEFILEA
jgi:heme exporter protein B